MERRSSVRASLGVPDREGAVDGRVFRFLDGLSAGWIWGLAAAMIVALGMVDILTGPDLGLSLFYLLPILSLAWSRGRGAAWLASFLSAGMWLMADVLARRETLQTWIHIWNGTIRLSLFLIVSGLVVEVRRAHAPQRTVARTDALTGIANGREFTRLLSELLDRARARGIPISFAYIDVDHFKEINDALGHSEGDRVLCEVATILRRNLRDDDVLARLGGDEFGVALVGETEHAWRPLERARHAIREEIEPVHPTVSIGLATYLDPPATVDDMIGAADSLMYEVKERGRNQLRHRLVAVDARSLVESSKER